MRIPLETESLALDGTEMFVLRIARQLRQDGHLAVVLCLSPDFSSMHAWYHNLTMSRSTVQVVILRTTLGDVSEFRRMEAVLAPVPSLIVLLGTINRKGPRS